MEKNVLPKLNESALNGKSRWTFVKSIKNKKLVLCMRLLDNGKDNCTVKLTRLEVRPEWDNDTRAMLGNSMGVFTHGTMHGAFSLLRDSLVFNIGCMKIFAEKNPWLDAYKEFLEKLDSNELFEEKNEQDTIETKTIDPQQWGSKVAFSVEG